MAFMVPEYWYGTMYSCPDDDSGLYPSDMFDKAQVAHYESCDEDEVIEETGNWARLSAPGYSDATDWSGPYARQRDAREFILDHYEVHPDTGDPMDWDYVDDDVIDRLLGPPSDKDPGLSDLDIYTGDIAGTWGVSTLTVNPVTGTPYVRMFAAERDAVAYARDRVAKGPSLYYPRLSDQERPERNPKAKVYYVGSMPADARDEEGNRVFIPVYRILRGHVRGAEAILVFNNKGLLPGHRAIRWVLNRSLSIVGQVDEQQIRIRNHHTTKKTRR